MHRIFVFESQNRWFFSSEAKALLAVLPQARSFDPKGLGDGAAVSCERRLNFGGGFFSLDGDIGVSSDNNKRRDPYLES
jgi:hypothetical protein